MTGNTKPYLKEDSKMKKFKFYFSIITWSMMIPLQYMAGFIIYSALPKLVIGDLAIATIEALCPIVMNIMVGLELKLLEGSRDLLRNKVIYGLAGGAAALYYLYRLPVAVPEVAMTLYFVWGIIIDNDAFSEGVLEPFKRLAAQLKNCSLTAVITSVITVLLFGYVSKYEGIIEKVAEVAFVVGIVVLVVIGLKNLHDKKGGHK